MATVFTLAGAYGFHDLTRELRGEITAGHTVVPIVYPNAIFINPKDPNIATGARMFNDQVTTTAGPKIGFGYSMGAMVLAHWLAIYGPTSTVDPADLTFVLAANPVRHYTGFVRATGDVVPAYTPYTVTDFARQYDGWADSPSRLTTEAVFNAYLGMLTLHADYKSVTLDNSANVSWVEGNITYVITPTNRLPMLGPDLLANINWTAAYGIDAARMRREYIAQLDSELRPRIEDSYDRPVRVT